MANKIQIRRGQIGNLPTLDEGEFGFAIDVERLYIGNPAGSGNILMNIGGPGFDLGNGTDGYVSFFTGPNALAGDNDFFWDREFNRLGLRTDTPTHTLTVDGYITPATDNIHRLGTYDQRWEAIHLGPNSLHISSTAAETGQSFDWRFGIDQTTGNNGNFILVQGTEHFIAVNPIESIISLYADEVTVGGSIKLPEITAPLNEAGYGKIYVSSVDGNIHFVDAGGTDVNLVDNVTDTVDEHYRQHSDAIRTITKDLDGYADTQTVDDHYQEHSDALRSITKELDGYITTATDISGLEQTVDEHYQQHSDAINEIRLDLDGYALSTDVIGIDQTVDDHYQEHSDAIRTVVKSLDGYSSDTELATIVDEHYRQHSDAIKSITKDLDGYAADQTVSEHYTQHSTAIRTVIKSLDGYSSDTGLAQVVDEHYQQHSDAIRTITKDLDGYALDSHSHADMASDQTVSEHYVQHSDAIVTILKELDGYGAGSGDASDATVSEHYKQHSETFKTILKDLDGYALTSHTHVDLASDQTVSEHYKQHSETFKTILKDLDGYTGSTDVSNLEQTVDDHYQEHSDAIRTIVKELDGYASDQTVSEHYTQHSETFKTILKDLDGYALTSHTHVDLASDQTVSEHYRQHSDAIVTILKELDGYGAGSGDASDVTVSEHYKQHSETFKTILKELDGYSGGGGDVTGLEQTVDDHYQEHSGALESILKDLDGYTSVSGSAYGDGYVLFFTGEGSVAGDNDLFWDRVNNRLGIGTYQPEATLDVSGTIKTQALQIEGSNAADGYTLTSDVDGYGIWQDPALVFHRLIINEDGTLVLDNEGNPTFTVS